MRSIMEATMIFNYLSDIFTQEPENKERKVVIKMKVLLKKLVNWIKLHIYEILYFILLVILTGYIFIYWEKCVSMKFFEQFDGNNILFLVWIVLFILPFYDIEAKGWKFRKKGIEDTKRLLENASSFYAQSQMNNMIDDIQLEDFEEKNGGGDQ